MSGSRRHAPPTRTTRAPVSVVIAVSDGSAGLDECLAALAEQSDADTQVIAVGSSRPAAATARRHERVEWVEAGPAALVPELWSLGLCRAVHPIVAITTAHFRPAPDYLAAVRSSHARSSAAGIGGAIDPPRGGGAVAWATYFLRYSAYLDWREEREVTDFAGDNGTYKRAALAAHARFLRDGFWEQDLHRVLRAEGSALRFVPAIRVRQQAAFELRRFAAERFRHGLRFGRGRIAGRSAAARCVRVASAPLIPVVFLTKIGARVIRSGRDLGAFLRAFPALCLLVLAWSAGEGFGYLLGLAAAAPASPRRAVPDLGAPLLPPADRANIGQER